jgi:predicted transcriptional regulator
MTSTHTHTAHTGDQLVVEPQRFAIVPEWVLDLEVSDAALRLYALLLRYGGSSGSRMPSRRLLADRMRRSVDSVDRAMRDLETAGLVRVERRRRGRENLTNRYHVRTTNPAEQKKPTAVDHRPAKADQTPGEPEGGSRRSAATRTDAARGTAAARVAADLRPNRKQVTESPPPPTPPPRPPRRARHRAEEESTTNRSDEVLARCGITDLAELAERCQASRRALGLSPTRWAAPCLLAAIQLALVRGWPPEQIQPALLTLAADRDTRSPMRLAEGGPWWDQPPPPVPELDGVDLAALEAELDDVADQRPALQAKARQELAAEHLPVTRATVTARAVQILHRSRQEVA